MKVERNKNWESSATRYEILPLCAWASGIVWGCFSGRVDIACSKVLIFSISSANNYSLPNEKTFKRELNGRKNFNTKERVQVCGWFFIVFYFECVLPNARAHYFCFTFFIVFSSVSLALSVLLRSTVCAKLPRKHPAKIDDFHQRCWNDGRIEISNFTCIDDHEFRYLWGERSSE